MKYVKQMRVSPGMSAGQLVDEMKACGVLGAGRLAEAVHVLAEMFTNPDYIVFLGLAGPVIPGGLRGVIGDLIDRRCVDVVVTNGANVVHDVVEALGYRHLKGTFGADDVKLREKKLGRVGDIYINQKAFEALEKNAYKVLTNLYEKDVREISTSRLLYEMGRSLKDPESILVKAGKKGVPIFCPGLFDSMLGLHIWMFSQQRKLSISPVADLQVLSEIVFNAKRTGAVILGGGLPKHYILGANMLRDGINAAVQITLDRPEGGSLSGAPLEEAISWRKAKAKGKLITVIGDMTIVFPVIVAAALEEIR